MDAIYRDQLAGADLERRTLGCITPNRIHSRAGLTQSPMKKCGAKWYL